MATIRGFALTLILLTTPSGAAADAVLLLGESYGRFGSVSPTGHAALYLTRICAQSPLTLRRCTAGERGVVVSRYHRVSGVDWIAIPALPYFYAVERSEHVPAAATTADVLTLRDAYRRTRLEELIPDRVDGTPPPGNWVQLVGAAYDRTLLGFSLSTTTEQDDVVIAALNMRPNVSRFNIVTHNCADFVRDVIQLYDRRLFSNNWIADLGVTTPKQLARSLIRSVTVRPELRLTAFSVPQVPGSRPHSRPARGVLETLLKSKKYVIPMTIVQPWLSVGVAAGYLVSGRFNPYRHVEGSRTALDFEEQARPDRWLNLDVQSWSVDGLTHAPGSTVVERSPPALTPDEDRSGRFIR